MDTRAAGKRFEVKCAAVLENLGFAVERANPKLCFLGPGRMISKAHDLFGSIDFVALHPVIPVAFWVQCTIDPDHLLKKRRLIESQGHWNCYRDRLQVWSRDRNNNFRIVVWTMRQQVLAAGVQALWEETSFRPGDGRWPEGVLGPRPAMGPPTGQSLSF